MASDLLTLLRTLAEAGIEFIVVGGMAGALHGAPVVTADLDIVHRRSDGNVTKLLACFRDLDAVFRSDPRQLTPTAAHLSGRGHLLLSTRFGPLDALCEIHGQGFEELLAHTETLTLGEGLTTRVVSLPKLIELKQLADRPKDRQVLAILRATLREANQTDR